MKEDQIALSNLRLSLISRSIREDSSPSSVSGDQPNADQPDPTAEPDEQTAILHQVQPGKKVNYSFFKSLKKATGILD